MCYACYALSVKYYPNLTDDERGELLMNATAFPFAQPEYIEKQLIELIDKTDGTFEGALAYADQQLFEEAKRHNEQLKNASE